MQLHRYELKVPVSRLPGVLVDANHPTSPLDHVVDFTDCFRVVDDLRDQGGSTGSRWDAALAGPLYDALGPVLTRREATDPRLWQWLCTATHFREFVWHRWHGLVPGDPEEALTDGDLPRRFLGGASLVGFARNALARVYWTVETLADGADRDTGVELAQRALTNTDLHLNVFERLIGLHPAAARAAIRVLDDSREGQHRAALVRLNRLATTTLLERMTEDEVAAILAESVATA